MSVDESSLGRSPPPSFIGTRRGGYMHREILEVVVFSPNQGCIVVDHCWKYTVGYGAGRGSCPRWLPGLAKIAPAS